MGYEIENKQCIIQNYFSHVLSLIVKYCERVKFFRSFLPNAFGDADYQV